MLERMCVMRVRNTAQAKNAVRPSAAQCLLDIHLTNLFIMLNYVS